MRKIYLLALAGLILWLAQGTLARPPQTRLIGHERLVSVEPLPESGGEFCETAGPAGPETLMAALQQRQEGRQAAINARNAATVDTLVIFDRNAKGNVPPTRELYTPHGTFGIAVDEAAEEMFLTLQHDSAMVVFRKYAQKDESPLRLLQGDATGLADPHGIALDTKNGWVFISNHGAVSS